MKTFILAAALAAVAIAGCTSTDGDGRTTAAICTNFGTIEIELYDDVTPITAQNFIDLAESGYYDDVPFHRIITDFMMQGGRGAPGVEAIPDEVDNDLSHGGPGLLSMANAGPGTGSSQFFITFEAPSYPTHLDGKHTIFGEVTNGMDIVQEVEDEAATPPPGTPRVDVFMQTVLVGHDAAERCPEPVGVPDPVPPFECPAGVENTDTDGVAGDIITPGLICITVPDDETMVWARNHGAAGADVIWNLTGPDGGPLPDGWTVAFDDDTASLGARGASDEAAFTMMRVTVPDGTDGSFELELRTGHSVTPVTAHVELVHEEVGRAGDGVSISYVGRCASDGTQFDDGSFPFTLGEGNLIPGFKWGLIGMGESESATILIPAPHAYGDSEGPCAGDNADLFFDVTIDDL